MSYPQRSQFQFRFGPGIMTPGVKYLIVANVGVFALQLIFGDTLIFWFGLHPTMLIHRFFVWQLVTYLFLHGGFFHIFFNMLMLWLFGVDVERRWGFHEFLRYYFICGIGAGFFHLIFQSSSVIGASGAVYGVLIAFVLLYPNRPLFFFPFPIFLKAKYWALIFIGISLIFGISGGGHIAHFAHLGGIAVGFLYFKIRSGWRLNYYFYQKKAEHKAKKRVKEEIHRQKLRLEVDSILDKITEKGYNSLTDREIKTLKQASKLLARNENEIKG
ncbi:MAG: rhomboid family intramembrane serine protease [Calditrichaeota bacterium]|nr:rhomboid family intramembrane serine protease [Calditrichota bacterium]